MLQDTIETENARQKLSLNQTLCGLGCVALGAGIMFMLDPARGRRRRSLVRGKMTRAWNQTGTAVRKSAEYTWGATKGVMYETRNLFRGEHVDDVKLRERVRSAMGRAVSHPAAIEVSAHDGVVTLRGLVLSEEEDDLVRTVQSVRGVKEVINQLQPRATRQNIPALQGGAQRRGGRFGFTREYWPPTTRLGASMLGTMLGVGGAVRRDLSGAVMFVAGSLLLARGLSNLPARRIFGIGAGRRAIDVQKTINIDAPLEQVFAHFANFDSFPMFMRNVKEVRDHGNGRSHWVVAGLAGSTVEWDADITRWVDYQMIAWKSVEGSTVENAGIIKFQPNERGGTRVDIKLSYNPPGGAIGHLLAKVFGADPKSEMDEDLLRLKTTLETGHPPHDASHPVAQVMTE